jgi:hypothetical protein
LGVGRGANNSSPYSYHVTKHIAKARTWTDPLVQRKQRASVIRVGTWNVRTLYRSGSLMRVAEELARYKLDLVGVEEVRWDEEVL